MASRATIWFGLVGAPLLFLSNMQISFVLVPWVCGNGQQWLIHLAHAATLTLVMLCSLPAWRGMKHPSRGQHFIAVLSLSMSGFTGLVLLAHWVPNFLLGACE